MCRGGGGVVALVVEQDGEGVEVGAGPAAGSGQGAEDGGDQVGDGVAVAQQDGEDEQVGGVEQGRGKSSSRRMVVVVAVGGLRAPGRYPDEMAGIASGTRQEGSRSTILGGIGVPGSLVGGFRADP
jgi:hypothetical protein